MISGRTTPARPASSAVVRRDLATRVRAALHEACAGLPVAGDEDDLVEECLDGLPAEASDRDVVDMVVLSLRARVERVPDYDRAAARALLARVYSDVLGVGWRDADLDALYQSCFASYVERGISLALLDERLTTFDVPRLAAALAPDRDRDLKAMGLQMLFDRYFLKEADGRRMETPQFFWMRMAMGLALAEAPTARDAAALEFYDAMSTLRCLPSTSPTFFHAGTSHPQTGCYVLSVGDGVGRIFDTIAMDARIASFSAGFGNDWTTVPGTCAWDGGDNVTGAGPTPFLKVLDSSIAAFNRSRRRHSAACAYLETWHYDVEDFLLLRRTTGDERRRVSDISTANWIPDLFMKRVAAGEHWTLFSPDEVPDLHGSYGKDFERRYVAHETRAEAGEIRLWRRVDARQLWRRMITALFETGHPWMTFKDACNVRSAQDHVGFVGSANLCTEIVLNASPEGVGVTTLGSVNLARHVESGEVAWDRLAESVRIGVHMLDCALGISDYPSPAIEDYARTHRPVGLGVMGFQDLLCRTNLRFDSDEACDLSDRLLEFVSYHAIDASCELARRHGRYESFAGSKWDRGIFPLDTLDLLEEERGVPVEVDRIETMDWDALRARVRAHGMRNCNVVAIAPTQTLANIAGCFPSIEPAYKQLYVKSNSSGEFTVLNEHLVEELAALRLWGPEMLEEIKRREGSVRGIDGVPEPVAAKHAGAFEIDPRWYVEHAARRGKWIDQGQSVNLFTTSTSGNYIAQLYESAWRAGLKTTYYLKTIGASSIEKSTVDVVHGGVKA